MKSAQTKAHADHKPAVSIIMPVYNAEKYLRDSIGSVLSQTRGDWELICFNDASSDGSLDILRRYAATDNRIRVIDSPVNVKQGGGRNRCLRQARGKYVMFLDADDALDPRTVEICLDLTDDGADMVVFDYRRFTASGLGEKICQLGDDAASLKGDGLRRRILERTTPIWSAMYDRRLITDRGLWFPEGVFYEDNAVAMAIQLSAQKPVKVNEPLYLYRYDNASVTRSLDNYRFFDRLGSAVTLLGHLRRLGLYNDFKDEIDFLFINQYYTHSISGCIYRFSRLPGLRHRYIRLTITRHIPDFKQNPYYRAQPIAKRLKIALHARAPRLTHALSRLKAIFCRR